MVQRIERRPIWDQAVTLDEAHAAWQRALRALRAEKARLEQELEQRLEAWRHNEYTAYQVYLKTRRETEEAQHAQGQGSESGGPPKP